MPRMRPQDIEERYQLAIHEYAECKQAIAAASWKSTCLDPEMWLAIAIGYASRPEPPAKTKTNRKRPGRRRGRPCERSARSFVEPQEVEHA